MDANLKVSGQTLCERKCIVLKIKLPKGRIERRKRISSILFTKIILRIFNVLLVNHENALQYVRILVQRYRCRDDGHNFQQSLANLGENAMLAESRLF